MRIISTRKLRFYNKDRSMTFVTSSNNIIEDCPDWAVNDSMFQAGRASGVVQVISSRDEQKKFEEEKILPQNSHEVEKVEPEIIEESEEVEGTEEEVEEETPAQRRKRLKAERKAKKAKLEEAEEEE